MQFREISEGLPCECSLRGNADLFGPYLRTDIASGEIQKLDNVRPEQRIGQLTSGHSIGSKDGVRSGAAQLFAGFFLRDPRDNGELRVQSLRGENDEQVFC